MNKITRPSEMQTPEVTTGPIQGSYKVYDSPDGHPDVKVPFREIWMIRYKIQYVVF